MRGPHDKRKAAEARYRMLLRAYGHWQTRNSRHHANVCGICIYSGAVLAYLKKR